MTDRKLQILQTAADVLENKSFAAFSYQDLAERLGIRKASIHHHFATKDDLGRALIAYYQENGDAIMGRLAEAGTPGQAIAAMLDLAEEVLLDAKPSHVCPSGAFEIDAGSLSDEFQTAIREFKQRHLDRVAGLLDAARAQGEVAFLGDPADQSAIIMAALQGAREADPVLGRDFFRGVVRQLKRSMGL